MRTEFSANLQHYNTFGFAVKAAELCHLETENDIEIFASQLDPGTPWRVLGGGSNIVLRDDLPGKTAIMALQGKKILQATDSTVLIEAAAGENWHDFVSWTLEQNCPGLENLALIPGTVGAAPIQNIGAYGLEIKDVFHSLKAYDRHTQSWRTLFAKDCHFAYRHSIFKEEPQRYLVASVTFALQKPWQVNLAYADVLQRFKDLPAQDIKPRMIFDAICEIRRSKLPDPQVLGNAGSFFHNPVVDEKTYLQLKERFPQLVAYANPKGWKLAAGWLIDQCAYKAYRRGQVGVYEKQALVLVHYGEGTGQELIQLAQEIQAAVQEKFGVTLSIEPSILP